MICCTENKLRYVWETRVYLTSLREFGYSSISRILIFSTNDHDDTTIWKELQSDFPEVKFFFYFSPTVRRVGQAFNYPPIQRLYCLQEHWKTFPNLEKEAIFYTDTDVVFTRYLDFSSFLKDNINYLSWTGNIQRTDNYLWQPYLDSKLNKVDPLKIEQYKKLDIVSRLGQICGITRDKITENNINTGGAQYLLKNITKQFWTDCFNSCCEIKMYLADINKIFMQGNSPQEKENNGFQSWCADMWAVLYNLWRTSETICPVEFDFAWSTDRVERLKDVYILHNAGVTNEEKISIANSKGEDSISKVVDGPLFFKGKYNDITPFEDSRLIDIYNNFVNKQFCNNYYIKVLLDAKRCV